MATPRLNAERIVLWRQLDLATASIRRSIDVELADDGEPTLAWFQVLSALRDRGTIRVGELCEAVDEVPSSLSRRLDRMEQEGLIERSALVSNDGAADDRRAVVVSVTSLGRQTWRDASVTFRRALQAQFASHLDDADVAALERIVAKLGGAG